MNAALRVLSASNRRCWRRRARTALTDRACARRNWHGARATSSVDGWVSMALRLDVVEAAGAKRKKRTRVGHRRDVRLEAGRVQKHG